MSSLSNSESEEDKGKKEEGESSHPPQPKTGAFESDSDSDGSLPSAPRRNKVIEDDDGNDGEVEDNMSVSSKGIGRKRGSTQEGSDSDDSFNGDAAPGKTETSKAKEDKGGSSGDGDDDDEFDDDDDASSFKRGENKGAKAQVKLHNMSDLFGSDPEASGEEEEETFDAAGKVMGVPAGPAAAAAAFAAAASAAANVSQTEAPPVLAEVQIPALPGPPEDAEVYITRLPNIVGIKAGCFDSETFNQSTEDDTFKFTTNIMRWRYKKDANGEIERDAKGNPVRETNTRLVKWSDGSMQLLVGDEAFEVARHALDSNYIYARQYSQDKTSCLECQGRVKNKLTFKPTSLQTKAHRNLALAVRATSRKAARIMSYSETMDPEKMKESRVKSAEELERREKRRNKDYSRYGGMGRGSSAGMNANYLEDDDGGQYDDTGINALKSDTRKGRYDAYTSSSSEEETRRPGPKARRSTSGSGSGKRVLDRDDSESDDAAFPAGDDSDEEAAVQRKGSGKRRRLDDDEDEG
ncbi:unnamed protein product [Chrysoparadoxa australica]